MSLNRRPDDGLNSLLLYHQHTGGDEGYAKGLNRNSLFT